MTSLCQSTEVKYFKLVLFLLVPFLTHCSNLPSKRTTLEQALKEFSISPGRPLNYHVEHSNSDNSFKMIVAVAANSDNRMSLTLFKNEDSAIISQKFEEKIVKYKSIFEDDRDPYFPVITKQIKCEQQYLSQYQSSKTEKQEIFSIQAFGNERSDVGACDESTVRRKILLVLLKCKTSLAEIQFSTGLNQSLDQFKPYVESLKCL